MGFLKGRNFFEILGTIFVNLFFFAIFFGYLFDIAECFVLNKEIY